MKKNYFKKISMVLVITFAMTLLPSNSIVFADEVQLEITEQENNEKEEAVIVKEMEELREEYSKKFLKSDGTYEAVVYNKPIHYKVGNKWLEIDNTLEENSDEALRLLDETSKNVSTDNEKDNTKVESTEKENNEEVKDEELNSVDKDEEKDNENTIEENTQNNNEEKDNENTVEENTQNNTEEKPSSNTEKDDEIQENEIDKDKDKVSNDTEKNKEIDNKNKEQNKKVLEELDKNQNINNEKKDIVAEDKDQIKENTNKEENSTEINKDKDKEVEKDTQQIKDNNKTNNKTNNSNIKKEGKNILTNKNNNFNVNIAKYSDSNQLIKIYKDKYELSWSINNINSVKYENVLKDEAKIKSQIDEIVNKRLKEKNKKRITKLL